jgi:adenylosuccinate synthase
MRRAFLVAGLGWGDEAKGATVDKLCRSFPVDLVVRYNGGCQAAHNVVTADGTHHTFSQFGAGMLAHPRVRTHLSRFVLIEPFAFVREGDALRTKTPHVWERTTVDKRCVVITPLHAQLNRFRELARGNGRHGSCGRGIGVARELSLKHGDAVPLAGDLEKFNLTLYEKIDDLWKLIREETYGLAEELEIEKRNVTTFEDVYRMYNKVVFPPRIVDAFEPGECMVFEGAQGVLLDETHGDTPYTTWTNTTFENADALLDEAGWADRVRIGCLRSYHTRHGAGPFATEDLGLSLPEPHNEVNKFQGAFRVGRFDWTAARRALAIAKRVDWLAVSHLDCLPALGEDRQAFLSALGELGCVGMCANGPTAEQRTLQDGFEL